MTMATLILRARFALVFALGLSLASCHRNDTTESQQNASAPRPHGELIDASPAPPSAPAAETSTNDAPKRKHPKPPSVQRRTVLAELTLLGQSNADNASLPSGTLGTAADLAKTNLPPITSLAVPDLRIPGYRNITFSALAGFDFALTPDVANTPAGSAKASAAALAQIPSGVRALDGSKIVIEGFLLPVRMNDGLAVEFLLMRNQSMCCYGVAPKINEWMTVAVKGQGVKPVMDQPIAVAGVLRVGPILENGSLAGIYRLDADKVSAPF
jgi:hypothetical protein